MNYTLLSKAFSKQLKEWNAGKLIEYGYIVILASNNYVKRIESNINKKQKIFPRDVNTKNSASCAFSQA